MDRNCFLRLERPGGRQTAVTRVSLGGMRLVARDLDIGEQEDARLYLPGSKTPFPVSYAAVKRGEQGDMSVRFLELASRPRRQLSLFLDHHRAVSALKTLQANLGQPTLRNLKPVTEGLEVVQRRWAAENPNVTLYGSGGVVLGHGRWMAVHGDRTVLSLAGRQIPVGRFDQVQLGISDGDQIYLTESTVAHRSNRWLTITTPERIYRPERRVEARARIGAERERIRAQFLNRQAHWVVLEATSSGFSVLVSKKEAEGLVLGETLTFTMPHGGTFHGRLTYLRGYEGQEGHGIRVGVEKLARRRPILVSHWSGQEASEEGGWRQRAKTLLRRRPQTQVVRLTNRAGEGIVTLRNPSMTLPGDRPIPVVVIPPAYARKKEDSATLALVLTESFAAAKEPVLVVRYDGTNSLGESHRDAPYAVEPALHTAGFRLSRAATDLQDVIDQLEADETFALGPVAIVSSSLASVYSRRVVAEDPRVASWIVPLGAADARDVISNAAGGVDYLGRYHAGERFGTPAVLGHNVDMNRFCADAIEGGLGLLQGARDDLARIEVPVTWICGEFDYWVNIHRVQDVLSRGHKGRRELRMVPCGHVLRSSDLAMDVFGFVAQRLAMDLLGRPIEPVLPTPEQRRESEGAERLRLQPRSVDPKPYWQDYLLGNEDNPLGFDIITLTEEYQQLLQHQAEALDVHGGDRVVDLGAGTGNSSEAIVEQLGTQSPCELNLLDLVPQALDRARAKLELVETSTLYTHAYDLRAIAQGGILPFGDGSVDRCLLSLLLSYVPDPVSLLREVRRILRPGGRIVVSSMLPDSDLSGPMDALLSRVALAETDALGGLHKADLTAAIRCYVNDAARLLDLECEGTFRFFTENELEEMLRDAGFSPITSFRSFGDPGQAAVAVAEVLSW